jgi:hypothetical protein
VQMAGSFDHSRGMAVRLPSAAMRGDNDPGGGEVSTGQLNADRWIEPCAADSAVDRFDEDLIDESDELKIKCSEPDATVVSSRFSSWGAGPPPRC